MTKDNISHDRELIGHNEDLIGLIHDMKQFFQRAAVVAGIVVIFLMAFMAALQVQVLTINGSLDKQEESTENTAESTQHLEEVVDSVVEDFQTPDEGEASQQEIVAALEAVHRIENELCEEGFIDCPTPP